MRSRTYLFSFIFFVLIFHLVLVPIAVAVNKIMPLGDSITQGMSSGVVNEAFQVSYRKALLDKLLAAGYEIDFVGSLNSGSAIFGALDPADHEGHPGWTDEEIVNGRPAEPGKGNLAIWLADEQPEIVLLHIGTNGLDPSPDDVEAILDEIDAFSPNVWVVLARIINRNCITDLPTSCPESVTTMNFNNNVVNMAEARILAGDKIIIVDMENGNDEIDAVIDYHLTTDNPPGDMWDDLHPFETGYTKMADLWFTGLTDILPQAIAGPDQSVNEFESVTLDASGSSDPNDSTLNYQWVQTAGTPVVDLLPDDQAVKPSFVAPDAGPTGKTLTFRLTVTNEDELVSTDTVDVVVVKILPQADAGLNQNVNEFDPVTLDASGSVGVGLSYQWRQTAGTPVVDLLPDDQAVKPSFVAPAVGPNGETLTFELTVTDDDGITDSANMSVTVNDNPIAPTAEAGADQEVDEGNPVTLDGTGSTDSQGTITTYLWEQVPGGTPVQLSGASTPTATFTAPDINTSTETLTFQLTITDDDGLTDTDRVIITVHNPTSSDGGGGGGGGCFIATAADGSAMALHGKVLRELRSRFAMVNWKRLRPGDIIPQTPRAERAATPAFVVTMVVLIGACLANILKKPRKRWLKFH